MSKRKDTEWNRRNISQEYSKLIIIIKPQIQRAQGTPSRINSKISIPRHIRFKLQKTENKEKILKEGKGKQTNKQTNFINKEQGKELQQTSQQETCKEEECTQKYL